MFADAPGYGKEVDMCGSYLYLFYITFVHVHVHCLSMNKYNILLTNTRLLQWEYTPEVLEVWTLDDGPIIKKAGGQYCTSSGAKQEIYLTQPKMLSRNSAIIELEENFKQ